jgi:hypothetical protein
LETFPPKQHRCISLYDYYGHSILFRVILKAYMYGRNVWS